MRLNFHKLVQHFFCSLLFLGFTSTAFAQSSIKDEIEIRQTRISTISDSIENESVNVTEARGALRLFRSEARVAIETLSKQQQDLQEQLNELGAAPTDGREESNEIKIRRQSLDQQLADIDSYIAQAKLNETDSNRQLNLLLKSQRRSFLSEILTPERSALSPTLWKSAITTATTSGKKLTSHYFNWKKSRQELGRWVRDKFQILGLVLLFVPFVILFKSWATKLFSDRLSSGKSLELHRYFILAFNIAVRVIPVTIGLCLIYQNLISSALVTATYAPTLRVIIYSIMLLSVANGMAEGVFNPSKADLRVIPLDNKAAKISRRISTLAIILVGLGWTALSLSHVNPELKSLTSVTIIFMVIGISILVFKASTKTHWTLSADRSQEVLENSTKRWRAVKKAGLPLIIITTTALIAGYLNLVYFISIRLVLLLWLALSVWVLRRYLIKSINTLDKNISSKLPATKSSSRQAMLFWAGLFIDVLILVSLIPILLLALGVDSYSVRTGMMDAFTGITIGNFKFSIADILGAIIVFFVILFVTRFLQRTLDSRLFEKSGADVGFRNSFRTLLGYVGLIIAIFAAIGIIGLDLSSLAIIAGALSVGIGFGLQSIVNNFVSGLILLFERPVKVGDWVVTTSGEGIVKQISVRSTEIETFDRASIIVPNSELISSSVTNWTHKNKIGRVVIPVGVAYDSDTKRVRELLINAASKDPRVLNSPAPFVYFSQFGDSSLDLELRVFIKNIAEAALVKNNLRFEILDIFRQENIDIPFPQRDVNLNK